MSAAHEVGQGAADRRIEEMRLAAALRRGFRHAQVLMAHSLAEYHLLLEVGAAGPDGLVQGDLADLLQCPDARASTLVRDMGERCLIRTVRSTPDRRVVRIHSTPRGMRLTQEALHRQREALMSLSAYAGLPSVTSLLQAALRLYLGVDVSLDGVVARVVGAPRVTDGGSSTPA